MLVSTSGRKTDLPISTMSFNCKAVRFVCGAVVVFAALLHLSSALPMRAGPARGPFRVKRDAHATHGDATVRISIYALSLLHVVTDAM